MKRSVLPLGIALYLLGLINADYDPCPPAELIKPCTCSSNEYIYTVECGDITDMRTLEDVFQRSADRKFDYFALYNSTLMYLPAASLTAKQFYMLMLANVTMSAFFDQIPDSSNAIEFINLINCSFQQRVGWELFRNLNHLKFFQADDTEISKLGKSFAENVDEGLTNFLLLRTKTKKLHNNAFSRMKELFDLQIADSEITTLERSMFANPSKLENFNFMNNKIKELPEDLFSNMPYLKEVILTNNKITTISESAIGERFNSLTELDLEGNPLICDCGLKWMVLRPGLSHTKGVCALPEDKTGKSVSSLSEIDFRYCAQ